MTSPDDSSKAKKDAFVVLRLIAREQMAPIYVYLRSGLTLAESQFAIDYLLERGMIAKKSDGFATIFHATPVGIKALE